MKPIILSIAFGLGALSVGATPTITTITKVYIEKRAVTYAGTCTSFSTLLGPTVTSCTSATVSGPYVTQTCLGVPPAITICGLPVTASTCSGLPQTCSTLTFAPFIGPAPGTTCYADSAAARQMTGASTTSSTMSNAVCKTFCNNLGFAYSGTEYSTECYCSNILPSTTSTNCNMVCGAPNSVEYCGGPNALTVTTNSAIVAANAANAAVFATWTSQGCYGDNYPTRVLSAASTTASTLSLESCVAYCNAASYILAGVEYGNECYCANSIFTDGSTFGVSGKAGCSYNCVGKTSEICGGANVLNLYSKNPTVNTNSAPAFAMTPTTANSYTLQNCYQDSVGSRTLTVSQGNVASVGACVTLCFNGGFKYAGLEFRGECWCDNVIHNSQTIAAINCNMACTGTPAQTCGGANAIQIYMGTAGTGVTVPQTSNGYTYQNTYADSPSARVLPNQVFLSSVSVGNCVTSCSNMGFAYAGVEYGQECWCGSSVSGATGGLTPNMVCTGNSAQFCGGSGALQTYFGTPSPTLLTLPFTNGICIADNTNNVRSLSFFAGAASNMTPTVCRASCTAYTYYGVEYGNECYCGNSFPSGTVTSNSCTMQCAGNSALICGGPYALNIYNS